SQYQLYRSQYRNPEDWVPPGWDLWYAFTSSRARYYDYAINENELIKTFGSSPGDYSTDVLKARAVRFIQEQKGAADPFFMLVATKAAHAQGKCAIPAPQDENAFKTVSFPFDIAAKKKGSASEIRRMENQKPISKNAIAPSCNRCNRRMIWWFQRSMH